MRWCGGGGGSERGVGRRPRGVQQYIYLQVYLPMRRYFGGGVRSSSARGFSEDFESAESLT